MSVSNGVYRIRNAKSGTYLCASPKFRGVVYGWVSEPGNELQHWRVQRGGGSYTFQNVALEIYLTVDGTHDGSNVHASSRPTDWNVRQEGGYHVILAEGSHSMIDLDNGRREDKTSVNMWGDSGALYQRWKFERIDGQHWDPLSPIPYFIRNVSTGTALDLFEYNPEDGSPVVGFYAHTDENQRWLLELGSRGYRIRNVAGGSYLGFEDHEQPQEGLLITGNSHEVEWDIRQSDQGYQLHLASDTRFVLDLDQGNPSDGTKICLWLNNNGNNQKWWFDRV